MLAEMDGILTGNEVLARYWYAVDRSLDVQGAPRSARLLGRDLVLWRGPNGNVIAAPDRCPHREAPLSAGSVEHGCLVCPYHGWTFGDEGRCVRVPSAGDGVPPPPRAHLRTFHCTERYGLVWVCLGEPAAGIPEIDQEVDPHVPADQHAGRGVAHLGDADGRQLPRHQPLPVRPHRHVRRRAGRRRCPKVELDALDDDFHGYRYEVFANNSVDRHARVRAGRPPSCTGR